MPTECTDHEAANQSLIDAITEFLAEDPTKRSGLAILFDETGIRQIASLPNPEDTKRVIGLAYLTFPDREDNDGGE